MLKDSEQILPSLFWSQTVNVVEQQLWLLALTPTKVSLRLN
ncbi:hypothetical protein [Anabaena subtropica]|nr:hypothetical protein [Anabaena subtropica]